MENIRSFLGLKTKSSARKHRTRKHKTRKHSRGKSMRRGGTAHTMHMGGKSVGGNVLAEAVVPFGLYGVQKMLQRRSKKSKKDSRYTRSLKRAYFL
jgi:hypothetical protein